jgi:hypothetical protein
MNLLTPSQIEVLARFDGWVKMKIGYRKMITVFNKSLNEEIELPEDRRDETFFDYFTSPGVLIEMRLKLMQKYDAYLETHGNGFAWFEIGSLLCELDELILSGEYTAAAIKTSELIQKLEA